MGRSGLTSHENAKKHKARVAAAQSQSVTVLQRCEIHTRPSVSQNRSEAEATPSTSFSQTANWANPKKIFTPLCSESTYSTRGHVYQYLTVCTLHIQSRGLRYP